MSEENSRATFAHTRSLVVESTRKFNNRTEGLEQIFIDIFAFKWSENVTRITPKDEGGFFSITFRDVKSKEIVEMQWENKKNQGK